MASFEQGYAVVVGIAGYHESVGQLSESVLNDARDIAALLTDPERCGYPKEQVRLLLDSQANRKGLLSALDWLAEKAPKDATAIFYFSGHGFRQRTPQGDASLLAAHDAKLDGLKATGLIAAKDLTKRLKAVQTKKLVTLLDCCHAGAAAELKGTSPAAERRAQWALQKGLAQQHLQKLGAGEGRAIIASSTGDEPSLVRPHESNSLFTLHLLEALAGAGTEEGKREVGILDVFNYVQETVSLTSDDKQHPILKAEIRTNFPLALKGKPPSEIPAPLDP